jgi:hypothetical protein
MAEELWTELSEEDFDILMKLANKYNDLRFF